jgi:phosphoglycolate phosphatase-like HAD superfamily hydrolase
LLKAALFDVDGTLIDSVDLHAMAWQEAFSKFGHEVTFADVRRQIGKGGDKLIPVFLARAAQADHGKELDSWRSQHFKTKYLPLVRPFSAVPQLLQRARREGLKIAIVSSAKKSELQNYLEIAGINELVDVTTSSDDVDESKPAPDAFLVSLDKLGLTGDEAIAIGDAPYDAEAAGKAKIRSIGVLSGGFTEDDLRRAGCTDIYPGPAALLSCFDHSPLGSR